MPRIDDSDHPSRPKPHTNGVGSGNGRRCSDDRVWGVLLFCLDHWHSEFDRLVNDLTEEWSLWERSRASDAPTFQDLEFRIRSAVRWVDIRYVMLERLGPLDRQFDETLKRLGSMRDEMKAARAENRFEQEWTGKQFVETWRRLCTPWQESIAAFRQAVGSRTRQPLKCARSSVRRRSQSDPQHSGEEDHGTDA